MRSSPRQVCRSGRSRAPGRSVVLAASDDPEVVEAWCWSRDGGLRKLTDVGGVSAATGDGPVKVVQSRSMSWPGPRATVVVEGSASQPLAEQRGGTCGGSRA